MSSSSEPSDEFDDPDREAEWLDDRRAQVAEYLRAEGVQHGGVADEPGWFVAPYVSIWPIMSARSPGAVGWWAIAGDLPTDYISSRGVDDARAALRSFAARWTEVAEHMARGKAHPSITIGQPADWPELGDLLARRAQLLGRLADDDENWA